MTYNPGDTISVSDITIGAVVTTNSTALYFLIPLSKPVNGNVSFELSYLAGRENGQYFINTSDKSVLSNIELTCSNVKGIGMRVIATQSGGWGTSSNNISVGVEISGTITVF